MSILQEYEMIKRHLGQEKWWQLNHYCNDKEILLSDVLYKLSEWEKFESWGKAESQEGLI